MIRNANLSAYHTFCTICMYRTFCIVCSFSYIRGLVHSQLSHQFQTINREFYCKVWGTLREDVRRKRPGLWSAKNYIFHDDNALCHRSLLTRDFLAKTNIVSLSNLSDSPYLTLAESISSPSRKCISMIAVLIRLPRFRTNHRKFSSCLRETTSRLVSKSDLSLLPAYCVHIYIQTAAATTDQRSVRDQIEPSCFWMRFVDWSGGGTGSSMSTYRRHAMHEWINLQITTHMKRTGKLPCYYDNIQPIDW